MEPTVEPTIDPILDPTTTYSDQLDIIIASNDVLINRIEMLILLMVFLSCLFVYTLFRRSKN